MSGSLLIFNLIAAMGSSYAAAEYETFSAKWYGALAIALLNGLAVGHKLYETIH